MKNETLKSRIQKGKECIRQLEAKGESLNLTRDWNIDSVISLTKALEGGATAHKNMKNTKQIIVLRKFPNLRTGKYASQAAHASMAFLTKHGAMDYNIYYEEYSCERKDFFFKNGSGNMQKHYKAIDHWLSNSFRKIVCYVETEEELLELHKNAFEKGLMSHLVEDNGATEFGGIKTTTALAIGPHWDDDFVGVTDHLKLF